MEVQSLLHLPPASQNGHAFAKIRVQLQSFWQESMGFTDKVHSF